MVIQEIETMINRLVQLPLKNQIKIDFRKREKIFRLSAVIYRAPTNIPLSLEKYVKAREGLNFRPHKTSYTIDGANVVLIQEFPFQDDSTIRDRTIEFWRLAKHCNQMLSEIAAEG